MANTPKIGMMIQDEAGRIGVISEVRYKTSYGPGGVVTRDTSVVDGFFARPANLPYLVGAAAIPGAAVPGNATLITVTYWTPKHDGSWQGKWADSPLHACLSARLVDDPGIAPSASDLARRGGQATSPAKAAAARANGRKGGWPKGRPRKPA